jgi:hypothetical protein
MPIEPQWLLDALGMAEFRPGDRHNGPIPRDERTVEITSVIDSPSGPLTKRTVVNKVKALVLEQYLYDSAGTLLASSVARSHRYYPESGVSLPQEIEIRIPPADLAMTVNVGTVELNRLADNPALWELPSIPGAPPVDLGSSRPSMPGGGAPTLGRQINDANWFEPPPAAGSPTTLGALPAGPTPAPVPVASTPSSASLSSATAAQPTPQFVPPAGMAVRTDEMATPPSATAQRLPTGGMAPSPVFTR